MSIPVHVQAAFDRGESALVNGHIVSSEEAYLQHANPDQSSEAVPTSAPESTAKDSPASVDTTKAELATEKKAHVATKAELATTTKAVDSASKLLKKLIPKKVEDLKKLSEAQLKAIVATYEVKTEGLDETQTLEAISKAVHG
ncbi:MAG: hypothetical protein JST12_14700 [Armatimonadetes bacterium]|nr:hypothetical protein [Armatimonadota bacterium]